jgi:hypothetical protein
MEGVQHRDRVGQPVADGVGVNAKRVERGMLNLACELLALRVEQGFVDSAGAVDDGVERPGAKASGLVTGQIDHAGDGPVDPDPRRPPDVLIVRREALLFRMEVRDLRCPAVAAVG